jgi:hypothetical protein
MATVQNAQYFVDNGVDFDEYRFATDAKVVAVTDTGNKITATNVEDALTEIVDKISILSGTSGTAEKANKTYVDTQLSDKVSKSLITATNDFIIGTATGEVAKKTLAETKTILGIDVATDTTTGVVELATVAEVVAGTDTVRAVTPSTLEAKITDYGNIVTVTTSSTLALTHRNKVIWASSSSAMVFTIPTNAVVAFPVGTQITVIRGGTGTVTFAPGGGAALFSKDTKRSIDGQYASATIVKKDSDTWIIIGALV